MQHLMWLSESPVFLIDVNVLKTESSGPWGANSTVIRSVFSDNSESNVVVCPASQQEKVSRYASRAVDNERGWSILWMTLLQTVASFKSQSAGGFLSNFFPSSLRSRPLPASPPSHFRHVNPAECPAHSIRVAQGHIKLWRHPLHRHCTVWDSMAIF